MNVISDREVPAGSPERNEHENATLQTGNDQWSSAGPGGFFETPEFTKKVEIKPEVIPQSNDQLSLLDRRNSGEKLFVVIFYRT